MKTKLKRFSKRTVSVVLAIMMIVTCMTVGIVTTSAYSISNNYVNIYFDNTVTQWSTVNFCIHAGTNLTFYAMSHIEGTNLWVWVSNVSASPDWFAFAQNKWGNAESTYDNLKGWNLASAKIEQDFTAGYAYMFSATSQASYNNGTGTAASLATCLSARWSNYADSYKDNVFKTTHHLKVKTKANGAASYSDNTSGNVASMLFKDGYYLYNNYNSADHGDGTASTTDADFATVKSGYFKLGYTSLSSNYVFDGWGTSSGVDAGFGSSTPSNQFTNVNSGTTYYGYFSEKTHTVTVKQQLGSAAATNVTTQAIGNLTAVSVSADAEVTSGGMPYEFDHWLVSGGTINVGGTNYAAGSTALTNNTISVKTAADNVVLTAVYVNSNEPLDTPSIKLNDAASNLEVNAKVGEKVTLSWGAVTGAGSYEVYKGENLVDTVTTGTSYLIEKGYSYSGAYKVKAIPSDPTVYSESAFSTPLTLTVNKVQLSAPTVTPDKTEIDDNGTVTFTLTNTNTSYTEGTDFDYKRTGANDSSYTVVSNLTYTTGTFNTAGDKVYKFKAVSKQSDYYTDSAEASTTINVSIYKYCLTGDLVTGQDGIAGWPTQRTDNPVNTFVSKNVFYTTVRVTTGNANDKHYFRLTDQSSQFTVTSVTDTDMSTHNTAATAVTASTTGTRGAMYVTGKGNFKIYVDQSNASSPKVWVVSNEWAVSTSAYYRTFNLQTNSYNTAQAGDTGGSVSGYVEVIKGQSTTLTATPESGYSFDGWYDSTNFNNKVSSDASWEITPTECVDYFALFKQNEPAHYTLEVAAADHATVTATYNGQVNEGQSISVPVGATVTISIVLDTGCKLDSVTPDTLVVGTNNFVMPGAKTTVRVNASKIDYTITGSISPNNGTLKFYSDAACTTEIRTAQYNDTFYAKYTPPTDAYTLNNFSYTGTGASPTGTSDNIGSFKMGTSNMTITANIKATVPEFGNCPTMEVYAGESFTYNLVTMVKPSNPTLSYSFGGTTNSTGTFTAPAVADNYTLTVTATNQPEGIASAATTTKSITIKVKYRFVSVKYYVDMHDNDMTGGKTVQTAIVNNVGTVLDDDEGQPCISTLARQESSTVYAAAIKTPVVPSGTNNYSNVYLRVSFNGESYPEMLNSIQVKKLISTNEVWLEAVNESSQKLKVTYSSDFTPEEGSTPAVAEGCKRIYLAKPISWEINESSWENIGIYHWGDYTDIGWKYGVHMTYLGTNYASGNDTNYLYYYADIPKAANNLIFQGWGTNQQNGNTPLAQTGNVENIGSANFFVLSKSGSAYSAKAGTNVTIPTYARHVTAIEMNVTETTPISIAPTYTGAAVTYTSSDTSLVTVDSDGTVHPQASTIHKTGGVTTITVKVKGTVGADIVTPSNGGDALVYTVTVSIHNPEKFEGFNTMSLESAEYTVNIPQISGNQPGYFDMTGVSATVTGILGLESSENSAIIKVTSTHSEGDLADVPIAYTVKYAKSCTEIDDYNDIQVVGKSTSMSIRRTGGERYGHKHWARNGVELQTCTTNRVISEGVETATTTGLIFDPDYLTYSAVFESYEYVDVTFNFDYYEYKPEEILREDGTYITNYQYDADYVGEEDRTDEAFDKTKHIHRTYTVTNFEVRYYDADTITTAVLAANAAQAIGVKPDNNYYDYTINASTVDNYTKSGKYLATVDINMTHSPKRYSVSLNGTLAGSNYTYQEYAELSLPEGSASAKWYACAEDAETPSDNDPVLATGTSYKFRVKGNTYLRTVTGNIDDENFNRSEVDFSHYEVTHRDVTDASTTPATTVTKEYLLQNFYIADFFDKNKFYDLSRTYVENGVTKYLPYDEVNFVGGGVIYYSMKDGSPNANTVSAGYVNDSGVAEADAVKEMLKARIMENYDSSLAAEIGEEDATKVAYGTKIDVTKNVENGFNTGVFYRYLPLETYKRDGSGNLEKDSDLNYTLATTLNDNTFRYSNALHSYQYVYASGNENKVTNNGKNMRLYAYYVYSYLTYDQETNLPEVKYDIVLSNSYSDASTYWNGVS